MPVDVMRIPLLGDNMDGETCPLDGNSMVVGILGTGDFSRSLARRLMASGYKVMVGSRNPRHSEALFPEEIEVVSQMEAVRQADVVFVAIFPEHYSSLLEMRLLLIGKTLVDISNSAQLNAEGPSNAKQLADLFPESTVVKGFNTISAWTLLTGPQDGSRQVFLCSDSSRAKIVVTQICRSMGFVPVDMGHLSSSLELENLPHRLFPSWRVPVLCTMLLFTIFYLYNFVCDVLHSYFIMGKSVFYKMPVDTVNVTLPSVALVLLALVYIPGLIAAALQLQRGTKYSLFPWWLDRWLTRRKQLGLCSFLCAALHAVYSLCLPMRKSAHLKLLNAAFKQVNKGLEDAWIDEEVWRVELYVSVGIIALGLLSLLAVASLPSVSNSINWREFNFIQSTLGLCALAMATLHTMLYGWDRAFQPTRYHFNLPPTFMLVLILPCTVLLGRLILALPCIALGLRRIRRGWERSHHVSLQPLQSSCHNNEEVVSEI